MVTEADFLTQLQEAIRYNHLTLPTLPEVALRVRDAVEEESATAHEIADMVATDAALSARLLQVANSPLYRGKVPIDSILMAVTRLGRKLVRNLVISLAMRQIFQATTDILDKKLRSIWEESVQIAAISRVLVQKLPHLEKDQALLAGLIHNIGSLPILTMAEEIPGLVTDEERLDGLLKNLSPDIGRQILETWGFPESLIRVPELCTHFDYDGGPQADYVDVVLVARLQAMSDNTAVSPADWFQVPAFRKVGLEPEIETIEIDDVDDLDAIKAVFL